MVQDADQPLLPKPSTTCSVTDELAHQLESYRELIDTACAIVWRADARTYQFTFVSAYAETLLGYPLKQWYEPGFWSNHIHPDDREWVVALCVNATREKRSHQVDYRMIAADGRVLWVRDICNVVIENDEPYELVGVIVDVTETKEAEQALAHSEDHLRQIVDTIPAQIWSGLEDGTIDFCNFRWRFELGMTLEELQGDGWRKMIHPDDQERVWNAWQQSISTGMPYEQVERHRMATGEYRWFLSRSTPLRDEHGNIVRWFGCNTDIQLQKYAEEALRKEEERWHGVFDNSRVGIALQDSCLNYVHANAAFLQMTGYRFDELKKMKCLDITYKEDLERYKATLDEMLSGRLQHFEIEKRYIRSDGKLIWARLNGSMIDPDGSKLWVTMAEDITERKLLDDRLQRERDRLRLLLDLNNKFVSKLDIREVFDALAVSLREIEGWDYSFVALPESAGILTIQLLGPSMGELKVGTTIPIEGTFAGQAYRTGHPEFFRVADLHPVVGYPELTKWREFARANGLQAGSNMPLQYDGEVLGVLGFHTHRDVDSARTDLAFLQELAKLVAIALHNALRYGELNESHEKLSYQKNYVEADFLRERGFAEIIGDSPAIREVQQQVRLVAPTDSAVLITGETGTGKELIARAIHDHSSRREQSFIKVDCAAIPAALMESELFGHEKGAFTGATSQKLGRFEIADRGTIFLDEVGDIPLELQTKLLRVLQDHSFERLGSNRTRSVNLRVIAATHRNLEERVEKGLFRQDLYYRLKVFPICIPPLRDRSGDIPALVRYFVAMYSRRMQKHVQSIPPAMMDVFVHYPWPGNVRELQHFIERSVILTSGRQLRAPLSELERIGKKDARPAPAPRRTLEDIERDAIIQALNESNWMIGGPDGAAAKLGLKRTTLASRMERLGISRPTSESVRR